MRRQVPGIILLLLAAWMGALTFTVIRYPDFFTGDRAEGREPPPPPKEPEVPKEKKIAMTSILVAARDLKWDEIDRIEADMLTAESYPNYLLPDGYVEAKELKGVEGQILMVDLNQGEPLLRYKLHRNQARLIEDRTALSQRAMAVKVNEVIGVAGFIKPYSRVDVLVTLVKRLPPETRTVLRNVLVLAAGPRGDRAVSPSVVNGEPSSLPDRVKSSLVTEQRKGEKQAPTKVTVVTLQVSPQQAEKLALASSEGRLQLVLRNPLDKTPGETQGIDLRALLAEGKPRGRLRHRVQVLKGSQVETQYFNK